MVEISPALNTICIGWGVVSPVGTAVAEGTGVTVDTLVSVAVGTAVASVVAATVGVGLSAICVAGGVYASVGTGCAGSAVGVQAASARPSTNKTHMKPNFDFLNCLLFEVNGTVRIVILSLDPTA